MFACLVPFNLGRRNPYHPANPEALEFTAFDHLADRFSTTRQRVTVADGAIESVAIQERIAEGGILIGYWDEDELDEASRRWAPRFSSHNPKVRETIDRLLHRHKEHPK